MTELDEIGARVAQAKEPLAFRAAGNWWLTFCITGSESSLQKVGAAMGDEGAENLGGVETGFLNAKLLTPCDAGFIVQTIARIQVLARACGADLVSVDVDTSSDVTNSDFFPLWSA